MTQVLNKKRDGMPPGSIYIGRGSPWGNPYVIGRDGSREDVVFKFERYARERLRTDPDWLLPLHGKDLVCFCSPELCHGDILALIIDGLL